MSHLQISCAAHTIVQECAKMDSLPEIEKKNMARESPAHRVLLLRQKYFLGLMEN